MDKEIKLLNEIIAMAIIHGGDYGGPYEMNTISLVSSINKWLRDKKLKNRYHVIYKRCNYTMIDIFKNEPVTSNYRLLQIVPIEEKGEPYINRGVDNLDEIE